MNRKGKRSWVESQMKKKGEEEEEEEEGEKGVGFVAVETLESYLR